MHHIESAYEKVKDNFKLSVFTWVKDIRFKFISCSENVAELAAEDSPRAMKSKDDYSLIWRNNADFFRKIDAQIIKESISYVNKIEVIDANKNGIAIKQKLLITKIPLINNKGKCKGIIGSHIILPFDYNNDLQNKRCNFDNKDRLWLPKDLQHEYLTKTEVSILKGILQGKTSKQIASLLKISYRTVEGHTDRIKRKLQCSSKHEIHIVAVQYGITHLL
jgi:DNA-binding CsgD family transcriptional regulator